MAKLSCSDSFKQSIIPLTNLKINHNIPQYGRSDHFLSSDISLYYLWI